MDKVKTGTGWIPLVDSVINSQYITRNSRWVNYLCYNHQGFVDWTISAVEELSEQLHATSQMAMQNRFIIYRLLAKEQGICDYFADQCCTIIHYTFL